MYIINSYNYYILYFISVMLKKKKKHDNIQYFMHAGTFTKGGCGGQILHPIFIIVRTFPISTLT